MPLWQIFGLAIVVFTGEVIWASYLPTPEQSAIVRKVMGSATFCLIFIGIEMAVFRKIEARKSSSQ